MSNRSDKLSRLIEYSREILDYAESGMWEEVIEHEVERDQLIRDFFAIKPAEHEITNIRNGITEILSINEKLTSMAISAREKVNNDARSINIGRRAVSAYEENI